jgi:hypothetical protein
MLYSHYPSVVIEKGKKKNTENERTRRRTTTFLFFFSAVAAIALSPHHLCSERDVSAVGGL